MLTFKSKDDVIRACIHANNWVKLIDASTTTPQCTFAVVSHNAPEAICTDPSQMVDAIHNIEQANNDVGALNLDVANLSWLNSMDAWDKSGHGPLMISFKTKHAANTIIDHNLAICGITCSVSIYVPQPPQCFQCQDWGHRAMDCTGEV